MVVKKPRLSALNPQAFYKKHVKATVAAIPPASDLEIKTAKLFYEQSILDGLVFEHDITRQLVAFTLARDHVRQALQCLKKEYPWL